MMIVTLAYIDPGVGALLWQSIIAAFVGFLFYLKQTRRWIAGLFRKIFGRNQKPPNTTAEVPARETVQAKSDVR
jgi:hypothetical protein